VTKKDFRTIANVLTMIPNRSDRRAVATTMADAIARTHPRFNRALFLAACNVEE
jgi:hypothetical protein